MRLIAPPAASVELRAAAVAGAARATAALGTLVALPAFSDLTLASNAAALAAVARGGQAGFAAYRGAFELRTVENDVTSNAYDSSRNFGNFAAEVLDVTGSIAWASRLAPAQRAEQLAKLAPLAERQLAAMLQQLPALRDAYAAVLALG
ncbi:MAG: hypothetical protein H7287_00345 [Thermoleophilia bacterium]|nr:hypothetical protein [Thermoleophilia bacterium]